MDEIKAAYEHSKAGTFMFNLCADGTKFLVKHRGLYYLLACTGGFILTIIGVIITGILGIVKIFSKSIHFKKYNGIYAISVGPDYWGGFEMGLMFCRDQKSTSEYLDTHEFGHTFQNCLLGPFMLFLVTIPSACRGGARELKPNKNGPAYDSVGFEDAATQCGRYADEYLNQK